MIRLKKAEEGDASLIADLASRIWHVHYVPIIGKEQVEYMLELMYSSGALVKQMSEGQIFFLILKDDNPVGYISVSQKEQAALFIHKFYVLVEEQGKGTGKQTFELLRQLHPGTEKFTLTVNRKNFKSINFYFGLGFRIVEVKDFDIGKGYLMEDFIMEWKRH